MHINVRLIPHVILIPHRPHYYMASVVLEGSCSTSDSDRSHSTPRWYVVPRSYFSHCSKAIRPCTYNSQYYTSKIFNKHLMLMPTYYHGRMLVIWFFSPPNALVLADIFNFLVALAVDYSRFTISLYLNTDKWMAGSTIMVVMVRSFRQPARCIRKSQRSQLAAFTKVPHLPLRGTTSWAHNSRSVFSSRS